MSDGTTHPISSTLYSLYSSIASCSTTLTAQTIDNSGFTLSITGNNWNSVYGRDGMSLSRTQILDSNGNMISVATGCSATNCTWNDTLGLGTVSLSTSSGVTKPTYNWTDVNDGSPAVSQLVSASQTIRTAFNCTGVNDQNNSSATAPTGFSFSDGTALGLTYEPTPGFANDVTGRIKTITLREGGTVTYTCGGTNNGLDCTYQAVPVLTRTLGNGDVTTYTLNHYQLNGSVYAAANTVVHPGGNKTVYMFTGFTSTGAAPLPAAQALVEVDHYQGVNTILSTDRYCYNTAFSSCAPLLFTTPVSYPITVFT